MSAIEMSEPRSSWGWFLTAGIALMLLGVACVFGSVAATLITVDVLGWLLVMSALIAVVQAPRAGSRSRFLLYLVSALLRGAMGYLLIRYPIAGELDLTILLGWLFALGGLSRAITAMTVRFPFWGWSVASGLVSLALGVVLIVDWPAASSWFIGLFVGVELMIEGSAMAALGASLHRLTPVNSRRV